jgi:hypothetical protein
MFPWVFSLMKMLKEEEEKCCQFVYIFIWCYLKIETNLGNPDFIDEKMISYKWYQVICLQYQSKPIVLFQRKIRGNMVVLTYINIPILSRIFFWIQVMSSLWYCKYFKPDIIYNLSSFSFINSGFPRLL